jgi:flagellar biosynthetic protein FliP
VTFGSFVGLCLTLAVVLALMAVTLRLLRRVALSAPAARGARIPLEVVHRLPLGPRQGLAIVRIGEQLVAVSVGEGGVRPILELDPAAETVPADDTAREPATTGTFAPSLLARLRSSGIPIVIAVSLALPTMAPGQATASATQRAAPPTAPATAVPRPGPVAQPAQVVAPDASALDKALQGAMPQLDLNLARGGEAGGLRLSGSVGIVIMLGLMTLLPSLILMMTSFTRILIVLNFVKQALGTQNAPPGQLMAALALILTGFVMAPTMERINDTAITPWLEQRIEQGAMMRAAVVPMREFMLRQVRERDLATFTELAQATPASPEEVSTVVLMAAFVTSELRTAFQLGFVLFLPFIVIDIVVSSVLMSMGMFMLPPAMIALPFKLLLFVLVDGWTLLVQGLVQGFK